MAQIAVPMPNGPVLGIPVPYAPMNLFRDMSLPFEEIAEFDPSLKLCEDVAVGYRFSISESGTVYISSDSETCIFLVFSEEPTPASRPVSMGDVASLDAGDYWLVVVNYDAGDYFLSRGEALRAQIRITSGEVTWMHPSTWDETVYDGSDGRYDSYSGNPGESASEPLLVKSPAEFAALHKVGEIFPDGHAYIKLDPPGGALDMSAYEWIPMNLYGDKVENDGPLEDLDATALYLDGNGTRILGISCSHPYGYRGGLFGYVYNARVSDFVLESPTIRAMNAESVGAVAAETYGSVIRGVSVTDPDIEVAICAERYGSNFGGAVGYASYRTMLIDVTVSGGEIRIANTEFVGYIAIAAGGVVGFLENSMVLGVASSARVSVEISEDMDNATVDAGCIAGYVYGIVANSYATGDIRVTMPEANTEAYAGGIAGHADSVIANNYAMCAISVQAGEHAYVGDAFGYLNIWNPDAITLSFSNHYPGSPLGAFGNNEDIDADVSARIVAEISDRDSLLEALNGQDVRERVAGMVSDFIGGSVDADAALDMISMWKTDARINGGWPVHTREAYYERDTHNPPDSPTNHDSPGRFVVSASASGSGRVIGNEGIYYAGSVVTLTASSYGGWSFAGWTASGVALADASSETISFAMPRGDVRLTANFKAMDAPAPRPAPAPGAPAAEGIDAMPILAGIAAIFIASAVAAFFLVGKKK
jgi:uncharacterized repeat protein (TIGR02543 family)